MKYTELELPKKGDIVVVGMSGGVEIGRASCRERV